MYLAAALALMVNLGCGKSEEEAVEQAIEAALDNEAEVDLSDEGMTITSEDEDGTFTWKAGDQAEIPGDFPDDVHIYEGTEMADHSCENCKLRKMAEAKPKSLVARLWRWHTGWCPGWKAYQKALTEKG